MPQRRYPRVSGRPSGTRRRLAEGGVAEGAGGVGHFSNQSMATMVAAGPKRSARGRKPLTAVLDNDLNISAGKADVAAALLSPPQKAKRATSKRGKLAAAVAEEPMETSPAQALHTEVSDGKVDAAPAPASAQKPKRAPSKTGRGKAAAAMPSMADELTELQGMLERMRLEKEKAEEMVRERDEVIRKKEEEIETKGKQQVRLQAKLKKIQRIKEFKPTMNFPMVQSLLDKDQEGEGQGWKREEEASTGVYPVVQRPVGQGAADAPARTRRRGCCPAGTEQGQRRMIAWGGPVVPGVTGGGRGGRRLTRACACTATKLCWSRGSLLCLCPDQPSLYW